MDFKNDQEFHYVTIMSKTLICHFNQNTPVRPFVNPSIFAGYEMTNFYKYVLYQHGPLQANLVLIAYASSEGSGEPVHPRSLARTSAARSYKQWVKRNLQTESQIPGPSEWLGMRS